MPVASPEIYKKMLKKAKDGKYAFPAINVTSMETARAVLAGLAECKSDGIIQVSTGGAQYAAGLVTKDMALGAIAIAEYVHRMAERFNIYVALHTDHCPADKLDKLVKPLLQETKNRRQKGLPNLFNSHMFDGSELSLKDNMKLACELIKEMNDLEVLLEVEAGVTGGEEDGHDTSGVASEKLYTTPEDMVYVHEQLSNISKDYLFAASFGNVHGVYKPGGVHLKPSILKEGQDAIKAKFNGESAYLVFHGGSGSSLEEIHETLNYGVIKMNIDTDMQYAYTRPIVDHMFKNYDGVLKIENEVGNKKVYDPRSYGKLAEKAMAERVKLACSDLRSVGQTLAA